MKLPEGATRVDPWLKATSLNKLTACLLALGMKVEMLRLGGGALVVFGIRPEIQLAVEARYIEGVTAKGAVSAKFDYAKVHDPIGIVRSLEADYSIGKDQAKRLFITDETARMRAAIRASRYNDGGQSIEHVAYMDSAGALDEWLDEWLDTLKVEHKRQSRKKAATRAERNELAILTGGTWEG